MVSKWCETDFLHLQYVCTYMYMFIDIYIGTYTCTYIYTYVHMYMYIYICIHILYISLHIYAYTLYAYLCTSYIYIYMHISKNTHTYTYLSSGISGAGLAPSASPRRVPWRLVTAVSAVAGGEFRGWNRRATGDRFFALGHQNLGKTNTTSVFSAFLRKKPFLAGKNVFSGLMFFLVFRSSW